MDPESPPQWDPETSPRHSAFGHRWTRRTVSPSDFRRNCRATQTSQGASTAVAPGCAPPSQSSPSPPMSLHPIELEPW